MWHKPEIKFNYKNPQASAAMQKEYNELEGFEEAISRVDNWLGWADSLKTSDIEEVYEFGDTCEQGARRLYQELTGRTYQSKIVIPNY